MRIWGDREGREQVPAVPKGRMQVRVVSLAFIVALVFIVLVGRLWYLQVLTGRQYYSRSQMTSTRKVEIPAERGVIYDRNGHVLANNKPALNVTVVPAKISRAHLKKLAEVLGANTKDVLARYDAAKKINDVYSPIPVKQDVGKDAVIYISEHSSEFPGVSVTDDFIRNYPKGSLAAHVIGYVGSIPPNEVGKGPYKGLPNDAIVGLSGVEAQYDNYLRGKPGYEKYNVDAQGRIVGKGDKIDAMGRVVPSGSSSSSPTPVAVKEPKPGDNLKLTIDAGLQQVAEKELEGAMQRARAAGYAGTGGAVIAMNPENGQILALASRPAFSPELFAGGITGSKKLAEYKYLMSPQANSPFTDRAIAGTYPAASTFKAFTGLAGLFYHAITPQTTYTDTGACWRPTGWTNGCWQSWREFDGTGTTHGTEDLAQALGDSNDKYFYMVADRIWNQTNDVNLLPHFYRRFGFGERTGVDLPGESAGLVPTSQWKKEYQKQVGVKNPEAWTEADWVNLAIGQGGLQVTPLQLIRAYAAIENGGTLVRPHVGLEITNQDGKVVKRIDPKPAGKVGVSQQDLAAIKQGLAMVTGPGGTAGPQFANSPLKVLGKTGTGQTSGDPVGWFVGWAAGRHDKPPLIVLVMVEHGGNGEGTSDVAVRNILEYYYGVSQKSTSSQQSSPVQTSVPPQD